MNRFQAIMAAIFLLGFLTGLLPAWILHRKQSGRISSRASEELAVLRERSHRLPQLEEENGQQRTEIGRLLVNDAERSASLRHAQETAAAAKEELGSERRKREELQAGEIRLTSERAMMATRLEEVQKNTAEKLTLLEEARATLSAQFKDLAGQIFDEKSQRFSQQNQVELSQLLDPLKQKITEFQSKVDDVYVKEGKDRVALVEQVRQLMDLNQTLSLEARNLTQALTGSSKTQGNWGELLLEKVLEESGLRKGADYALQESHIREDGGRAQPDAVIHLPEDRHLVIDAKVSLTAYCDFANALSDSERQSAVRRHLDSIRGHIRDLSGKKYQSLYALKSMDFVLMFVPVEPAFMLAATSDTSLFSDAWERNILLVSPSTLLFVLRTVAHLWRQEAQGKNAQEIARRGAEFYDRLSAFVHDLERVGERLDQAQDSYREAWNKLCHNKGNVIRQAELLRQLGVSPSKNLPHAMREPEEDGERFDGLS